MNRKRRHLHSNEYGRPGWLCVKCRWPIPRRCFMSSPATADGPASWGWTCPRCGCSDGTS